MPDLNDFHAFTSTSGSGSGSGGSGSSSGPGCFTWILIVLAILWIIGKFSG